MVKESTKLLVVTEFPPNASGGGPAIARQMLKDWSSRNLFWWSCLPERDKKFGQAVASHHRAPLPQVLFPGTKLAKTRSALLEFLCVRFASLHLERTARAIDADMVWVIPHNWAIPSVFPQIRKFGRGFHISLHDYVDVHSNPRRFGKARCARFASMVDNIYASATTTDAISCEMAEDLRQRTGRSSNAIIRYGIEPEQLRNIEPAGRASSSEIRIAYAGSVLVEREFALFVQTLRSLRKIDDRLIRLHLFGANSFTRYPWFDPSWMIARGNLPEAELHDELQQCDWGFSPMSLTDQDPRYNRFSFPTKFIAYLAAGLPVITLGHRETTVVKMAARYRVGLNSSSSEIDALTKEVETALRIRSPNDRFRDEIIRCARNEFDADDMRRTLYGLFSKQCSGTVI